MQRLTTEQAIVVSAYTGVLICDFSDLQKAVEKKLGRQVWTHEFTSSKLTTQVEAVFRDDFLALAPEVESCGADR